MGKVKSLFCSVVYYTVYNTEGKSFGIQIYLFFKIQISEDFFL